MARKTKQIEAAVQTADAELQRRVAVNQASGKNWTAMQGDCMEIMPSLPDNSVHYQIFSPAFASLYTYSNSERDMGNCRTYEEFCDHYRFFARAACIS